MRNYHEYADRGIRVNAVAPSTAETQLIEAYIAGSPNPDGLRTDMATCNPTPGISDASDVAATVAFLAPDGARSNTGITLPIHRIHHAEAAVPALRTHTPSGQHTGD